MHCELLVPGLFAGDGAERLPAAELLLARAREAARGRCSMHGWLHEAFGIEQGPHAAGALTLAARADPVHLRVMRDRLILVPGHALDVSAVEAQALCEALNRHFGSDVAFQAVTPLRWCARLAEDAAFEADSPLEAAGRDVDLALPAARGAPHRLLN
jgi:hypothetical protein